MNRTLFYLWNSKEQDYVAKACKDNNIDYYRSGKYDIVICEDNQAKVKEIKNKIIDYRDICYRR